MAKLLKIKYVWGKIVCFFCLAFKSGCRMSEVRSRKFIRCLFRCLL